MQVRSLTAYILRVPLRKPFRHASAVRHYSDNIIVQTRLADGTIGWGEGVPRDYVTGETAEGTLAQLDATPVAEQLSHEASNWQDVFALCQRFQPADVVEDPRGCYGNSLRSAVELSLLDAFGKVFRQPVSQAIEDFLQAPAIECSPDDVDPKVRPSQLLHRRDKVRYSTTIDAEHSRKLWRSVLKMRLYGFLQCKVKVGAGGESDARRLAIVRQWIGPHVDLRVDANEAWHADTMVDNARQLKASDITCIEQPLPHAELAALSELRSAIGIPVMLDESLTSLQDAHQAIRLHACDMFNIRISKCGGLLRSLRIAALAAEHGIGYQLGCHPGETGILSAAGRHFATSIASIYYLEGSYDRHVLAKMVTKPDLTFRYGGVAKVLRAPGLGVSLDLKAARKHLREKREFAID